MSNKSNKNLFVFCVRNPHENDYAADDVLVKAASKADAEAIAKKLPKKPRRYIAIFCYGGREGDRHDVLVLAGSDEEAWQMVAGKATRDAEEISNAIADDIAHDNSPRDNASVELDVELRRVDSDGYAGEEVKSGTFYHTYDAEPDGSDDDDDDDDDSDCNHDWCSPQSVVGGMDDNPGVFSLGGAAIKQIEVCSNCGMYRTTWTDVDKADVIEYDDADEDSEAWLDSLAEDKEEEED